GRFGHAVALTDFHSKAVLELPPYVLLTAAAPEDAHRMLAIRRRRRLLEQDLQHTAEVVDEGRPAGADLLPEPGGAEAVDHRERHIHERGQDKYLRAAYVEQRLPHKQDVAGACI